MNSSAALSAPVQAPACRDGAAEAYVQNSSRPRPVSHHRNGASKTVTHLEEELRSNDPNRTGFRSQEVVHVAAWRAEERPRRSRQGGQEVNAPTLARPALTVVPTPAPPADAIPLAAARLVVTEAFAALGVTTGPADSQTLGTADALLTVLLQAYGASVSADQATIDHAEWLGSFANLTPMEVAS